MAGFVCLLCELEVRDIADNSPSRSLREEMERGSPIFACCDTFHCATLTFKTLHSEGDLTEYCRTWCVTDIQQGKVEEEAKERR